MNHKQVEKLKTAQDLADQWLLNYRSAVLQDNCRLSAGILEPLGLKSTITQLFVILRYQQEIKQFRVQNLVANQFMILNQAMRTYLQALSNSQIVALERDLQNTLSGAFYISHQRIKEQKKITQSVKGMEDSRLVLTLAAVNSAYKPRNMPQDLDGLKGIGFTSDAIRKIHSFELQDMVMVLLNDLQVLIELKPSAGQRLLAQLLENEQIPLCQILIPKFWGNNTLGQDLIRLRSTVLGRIDILYIKYQLFIQMHKVDNALNECKTSIFEWTLDVIQENVLDMPLNFAAWLTEKLNKLSANDIVDELDVQPVSLEQTRLDSTLRQQPAVQQTVFPPLQRHNSFKGSNEGGLQPQLSVNNNSFITELSKTLGKRSSKEKDAEIDDASSSQNNLAM